MASQKTLLSSMEFKVKLILKIYYLNDAWGHLWRAFRGTLGLDACALWLGWEVARPLPETRWTDCSFFFLRLESLQLGGTVLHSQSPMYFTSYRKDVRDSRGSRRLLTFLVCLQSLWFSVARAEQLQGCSVCLQWPCQQPWLLPGRFWSGAHSCSVSFAHGLPLAQWTQLGLSCGNTDFPDMLFYHGSGFHCAYYTNIGFSSSVTLSCFCRETQKPNCSLTLTGRQTGSSHLRWMVSFSCFNKKQDWSY